MSWSFWIQDSLQIIWWVWKGKITSYALTKDYVLCGLEDWEETGKYHLLRYDFKADEKSNFSLQGALYRMCGGSENDALCVDMNYNIYSIDGDAGQMEKINGAFGFTNIPVVFDQFSATK